MQKNTYAIGDVSKQCGIKVPTIRFYEQIGLLRAPVRSAGNRREYGKEAIERLCFIRHARALGFEIDDIRELLELAGHPADPCAPAHAIAVRHLADVEKRIAQLKALRTELRQLLCSPGNHRVRECKIMRALDNHAHCAHD